MKLRERVNYILLVVMIFVVMYLVVVMTSERKYYDRMDDISEAWTYDGDTVDLPIDAKMEHNKKYVMTRVLPDSNGRPYILVFKTENVFWSVSVDGRLIDEYGRDDISVFRSKTAGDRWNLVELPENVGGKDVSITIIGTDAVSANFISHVYLAKLDDVVLTLNRRYVPPLVLSVSIMVFGLLYLALSELVVYRWKEKRQLTYLAFFAICAAVWTLLQSPVVSLILGSGYRILIGNYISLPWAMGFVLLAAFHGHKEKYPLTREILFTLPFIYGVLIVFLDLLGVVSFGNTLRITQAFAGIVGVGVIIHSVREITITRFEMAQSRTILALANIMLAASAISDVIRCALFDADDYSQNFRVAMLLYMVIVGMDSILTYAEEQNLIEGAGVMRQIAMHDGLTGVYNRMAFNDRVDILPKQSNVGFIHFDVNNLKEANDTYGHAEGDTLIKMAAHGIEKSFGSMGECYRYGGDEFTVVTEEYSNEKIKECMGNLRIYMALINHEDMLRTRLSMACGYAHFSVGEDENLMQTFERADMRMYENKRGMKELAARLGGNP